MKVLKIAGQKTESPEMQFLKERHNAHVLRQKTAPFKTPVTKPPSMIRDFLTLIGVLPIIKPIKTASKFRMYV